MLKFLLATTVLLALGKPLEIREKAYDNMQAREVESLQRILAEATNTAGQPSEIKKAPCSSSNRRSGGGKPQYNIQTPYQWQTIKGIPKDISNIDSNTASNRNKKYEEDTQRADKIVNEGKSKLGCKSSSQDSEDDQVIIQNKIANKIGEQPENLYVDEKTGYRPIIQTTENTNAEQNLRTEDNKKICVNSIATTESSHNLHSRRFMGDDTSLGILPSAYEDQTRDVSRYQQNLNLRSDLIRNQLLARIYNKGQVTGFSNDMSDDIYSDYGVNQWNVGRMSEPPNAQKIPIPQNKNIQLVKNHDLIEVSEKMPSKDDQKELETELEKARASNVGQDVGKSTEIARDKSFGKSKDNKDAVGAGGRNTIEDQLIQPTRGAGISDISERRVSLIENPRVCYACSSTDDVTCWRPNRQTTVKYCRKEHDACVTKTYKSRDQGFILIRDCSNTCDVNMPILDTKYASCSICKNDLCNNLYVGSNASNLFHSRSVFVIIIIAGLSKAFL